ncbi:MAG TPA: hypothetical protein VEX18_13045 [Polyangiaceae bacterium]|nr:hypothetical protein [Polyangiaceae bacterium]
MADIARKPLSFPDLAAPLDDEGSVIRPRDGQRGSVRPPQDSSASVRAPTPASKRARSSTRPAAPGSLDQRIERKLRIATALMRDLPSTDARVRLLHIAIMRRDESLLDGVLAELNRPAVRG